MNKPYELTAQEWVEVAAVRDVWESWGLEGEEDPVGVLQECVYAVRFDYLNGGPGYCGPLYILKGDGDPEIPPVVLVREEGQLAAV